MAEIGRREFLKTLGAGVLSMVLTSRLSATSQSQSLEKKPNFVILFADDMGYGDWSRGGHPTIYTPNMNKMANEGIQLTQFYSGAPMCSPARSALLTGRNYIRTGVIYVFPADSDMGMSPKEITIAEALKPLGYATACIGKWHLGDRSEFLPRRQGFDYYYGLLLANSQGEPDLYRNERVIQHPADQATLTKRYTTEAIKFIEEHKDEPFLLYLPYTFPHVPLFASRNFLNTSARGLYGDTIEEIDWSVGQINQTLETLGLDENTLVIFTSDNGPWLTQELAGGSSGLLRGAKGDTWEGGMREPFIAKWPGKIPPGAISMEVASVIDFFPTIVALAGGKIPDDRAIDGVDIWPILEGKKIPERAIFYYSEQHLSAVRKGPWKLHLRYYDNSKGGFADPENWITPREPLLFNLDMDPSEQYNVADANPEIVLQLLAIASQYQREIDRNGENKELIDWFIERRSTI